MIVVLAGGCGGAGGVRRMPLTGNGGSTGGIVDAGADAPLPAFKCSSSVEAFDCTAPVMLNADGHLVDFSSREWSNSSGKWCDESGYHGSIYSYHNTMITADTSSQRVADGSLRLTLGVSGGQYGGGGVAFEAGCMDVSQFSGVHFSAAIVSGSLAGCPLQLQLATFDQRPTSQSPKGGCDQDAGSCFNFPTATAIPVLSSDPANPTPVVLPFTSFSRVTTGTLQQVVGLQWQVNATGGACTVEILLDDIGFIPAAAPADAGSDAPGDGGNSDGGAVDDASTAQ